MNRLFNFFLHKILIVNYSLSILINDYKEYRFLKTCVRITSMEVFFILISGLVFVFPKKYTAEQFSFFGLLFTLIFLVIHFYLERKLYKNFRKLDIAVKYFRIKNDRFKKFLAFQGLFFLVFISAQLFVLLVIEIYKYHTRYYFWN